MGATLPGVLLSAAHCASSHEFTTLLRFSVLLMGWCPQGDKVQSISLESPVSAKPA